MYVLDNADMSTMYVNHSADRLFITESVKQNCLACICCFTNDGQDLLHRAVSNRCCKNKTDDVGRDSV